MKHLPANQCRRCGHMHDEAWNMVDPEGCWAVTTSRCECGHVWTMIHTAPVNMPLVRAWIARGCDPAEGPAAIVRTVPWQQYRLEGVTPTFVSAAS
ncbi:MAG TPA: hypothetical protein VD969_08665 [Symbiobacteriaceae bacterium]|nr:hypothetical protein [Symbiobacteriaceae bacterium]